MTNFLAIFGAAVVANVLVTLKSTGLSKVILEKLGFASSAAADSGAAVTDSSENAELDKKHKELLKRYLLVYLLATLSDWLQGPYVYVLYSAYGYEQHDIALLFVAGFGSSMVFGSFVGGMADWGGRRTFVVLYTMFYAASCMTKHFNNFWILMLGRLLGGVATSLLFSVFEAWLIRSHHDAKLKNYLGKSFSWAAYGNSIIAIVAGLVANNAASSIPMEKVFDESDVHYGGYLNPFDIALLALVVCGVCATVLWEENYGEEDPTTGGAEGEAKESKGAAGGKKWYDGLQNAFVTTIRNHEILLCGVISSFFEGSMYIFVFMWTPALTGGDHDVKLPFGLIFSTFMVNCMVGSSLFSIMMDKKVKIETLAVGIFAVASLAMFLIASATNMTLKFLAMNFFEICVGLYWPTMGTMKGGIVPESKRAAIYNLYRIPLNFIVLFSLLTDLAPSTSFALNGTMLAIAAGLQSVLRQKRVNGGGMGVTESLSSPSNSTGGDDSKEMMVALKSADHQGNEDNMA